MAYEPETMRQEIDILFGALCDGIRQEVRARSLARLTSKQDVSLAQERESGFQSLVAFHLRSAGFLVQTEPWIVGGDPRRRPDLRVWLPVSEKYLYLELKTYGWGTVWSYHYSTIWGLVKGDMDKLKSEGDSGILPNGLIVVGLSRPAEERLRMPLSQAYEDLSQKIIEGYSYEKVGVQSVDLQGMDSKTSYAMVGLWVRMASQ